jgi:hypothetical protein
MPRICTPCVRNALAFGLIGVLFGLARAEAGFYVGLDSTAQVNTSTQFNYSAGIAPNEQIAPGDSFTIYNFAGYVPGTITAPGGWSMSTDSATLSPNLVLPASVDPSLPALTFSYIGSSPIAGPVTLSGFSAVSAFGGTTLGEFVGNNTPQTGFSSTVIGNVLVPSSGLVSPIPAPEPSGLVTCAIGAVVFGLAYARRRAAL